MLRNKQEEKLKYLRRLRAYQDTLEPHKVDYVPVEKPFFIGWDVFITLSESGMRRRDAPDIMAVLNILGATKPQFTKSVKFIRYLRRYRYSVELTAGQYEYKNYRWIGHHNFPYWYRDGLSAFYITDREFEQVPLHLKRYFYKDDDDWRSRKIGKCYRLSYMNGFPLYELVYKVEKSYANALGVPRGDDISEDRLIDNILSENHYWSAKNGYSNGYRDKYWDYQRNIKARRAWTHFCQKMKHSDFSEEAEEKEFKYLKHTKHRAS